MKSVLTTGLLALAGISNAFPSEMYDAAANDPIIAKRVAAMLEERQDPSADAAAKIFEPFPIFNEQKHFVDVGPKSKYKWVAPGPNDQRGPCPGLNAFANHGILPHNGYATVGQFIGAVTETVGMGIGLATFLAVFGAAIDGSGTAWSIGGTPFKQGQAGGNGISNSHNKYEGDASPMRPDLYQYGNDYEVRVQQFQQLADLSPVPSNFDIPTLAKFRSIRFDTSVKQNPFFFNGPFTGVLVQPAAYTFIYRFMANHSKASPEGTLNRNVIQKWFSITGKDGAFKWVPGHERIPMNWYRRPRAYPYDQTYFFADVANAARIYPKFLNVGGNTGKKNSFVGVDTEDLSGGLLNTGNLLQGNNFACLGYQFAAQTRPDLADNAGLTNLVKTIGNLSGRLACPQLQKADDKQLRHFPGYTKAGRPLNG